MKYESTVKCEAESFPGVSYTVLRMSFDRRLRLIRELRELSARIDYHRAGSGTADAIESTLLEAETDMTYLRWGLVSVEGLEIDGMPATPEALFTEGPENLCREVVVRIRKECFLSADDQKN